MGFHFLLKGHEKKPVGHQVTHEQSPNPNKGNPLTRGCLDGLHANTLCILSMIAL